MHLYVLCVSLSLCGVCMSVCGCVCVWSECYTGRKSGNVNNKDSAKQALIKANRFRTEPLQKHVSPSDSAVLREGRGSRLL